MEDGGGSERAGTDGGGAGRDWRTEAARAGTQETDGITGRCGRSRPICGRKEDGIKITASHTVREIKMTGMASRR